jgi:hypothetical protein
MSNPDTNQRQDRTRNPDTFLSGPVGPLGESDRRRFFGED